MRIGLFRVKKIRKYSLYNVLWYTPFWLVRYEVIRIGQSLAVKLKLFNTITLGIYWDKL